MIHGGTISTGSAKTVGVCGVYWISSIRRLRKTTLPGVMATSLPGLNPFKSFDAEPFRRRNVSCHWFCAPCNRLAPPLLSVACSTSGLVQRKFDGDHMSRICRTRKAACCSWCALTPCTPMVASSHQLSCCWKLRAIWLNGHCCHSDAANRLSLDCASVAVPSARPRMARIASSCCLPGDTARCPSQSRQAADMDAGDKPIVSRASCA